MDKKFDLLYPDPPWNWKSRSAKGEGRSAKNHYSVMSLDDIKRLPIPDLANKDSVLCCWVIDPMLPDALDLIKYWGFKFATVGFYWVKTNIKSPGYFRGLGYYTRANPEQMWIARRGKGLKVKDHGVDRLLIAPRGRHSQKPIEAYNRLERLFGEVSRVELFARNFRDGWDSWGNEIKSTIKI